MAQSYFVNGPANIFHGIGYSVLNSDAPTTLALLGQSVDGVTIEVSDYFDPIRVDAGGPQLPATEQAFGMDALLSMKLELFDEAVVTLLRKRPGQSVEGVLESIGRVMAAADYHRIHIDSPSAALPWNFPTTRLARRPVKVGTTRSVWDIQLYAFAFFGTALSATGAVLYDRVTTGHP